MCSPRVGLGTGAVAFARHRASHAVGRWPFPCPGCPGPALDTETAPAVPHTPRSRRPPFGDALARLPPASAGDRSHWLSWAPLMEFLKDRPSTDIPVCVLTRLPEVRVCHTRTCSALVVLPDFGGFLRTRLAGLLHPAAGHGVHLVSSRPPTVADARPSSQVCCPSKLFAGSVVPPSPEALPPRRWSAVTEATAFPDLEDSFRPGVQSRPAFLRLHISVGASTSSHGLPRPRLSPESFVAEGSCWFPSCPVLSHRVSGISRTAAAVHGANTFPLPLSRGGAVALETGTGFPTVPVITLAGNHPPRDRSLAGVG
jgi:hypothetical protein